MNDEALGRAPLEHPGTIVRVPRGTSAEHLAALQKDEPALHKALESADDAPPRQSSPGQRRKTGRAGSSQSGPRTTKPGMPEPAKPEGKTEAPQKPRPSRARLDKAEQALTSAEGEHKAAVSRIRAQERALQQERRDLEARHQAAVGKLEAAIVKASESYGAALQKWRS